MSDNLSARLGRLRHELTLSEISGAFGDLGTFLPLLVPTPDFRNVDQKQGVFKLASKLRSTCLKPMVGYKLSIELSSYSVTCFIGAS